MIIIWTSFIFFNSLQIGSVSAGASGLFTQWIYNFLIKLGLSINIVDLSYIVRKLAHISEFFILSLLAVIHEWQRLLTKKRRFLHVIIFCLLIAVIDEVIQTFVPGRAGLLVDVLIDMIGVGLASILTIILPIQKTTF